MKSRRTVAAFVFLLFLLSGYVFMGYTRHYLYDLRIQKHIAEEKLFSEGSICQSMGWETHEYLGTPEGALVLADPVFREEIYSLCDAWLEYSTEYQIEILPSILGRIDDDRWSLWDAYKRLTIFEYMRTLFGMTSSMKTPISPHSDDDWGGSLAESVVSWESTGGKREGDWMEAFKQSSEYKAWLDSVLEEITNPKGIEQADSMMSMEDRYRETTRVVELPLCSSLLQRDMLETNRRMTETAYERFTIHAAEKDIIRTNTDAWTVKFASSNFISDATTKYTFPLILRIYGFPLRDLLIDTCIIIGTSVVLTFIVMRWVLPGVENRRRGTQPLRILI